MRFSLRVDTLGWRLIPSVVAVLCATQFALAENLPGEGPALSRIQVTQEQIEAGEFSLYDLRKLGRELFSLQFNKLDGYGDGPFDPTESPTAFGGRPTLQGNGTFLRVNGLDSQSCVECHFARSMKDLPMSFAVGGFATMTSSAMFRPSEIDVADSRGAGIATFNGRLINPPFLFGAGGIELLAKEMTQDLQDLKQAALNNPGEDIELITKGVFFGSISHNGTEFDYSQVEGIDADLVVKPFGRKGEFPTIRAFDLEAFQFHHGMQAVEFVGLDVDADKDGVMNELTVGHLSVVSLFISTLERPVQSKPTDASARGELLFTGIGCADCHIPALTTESPFLSKSFPEIHTDPFANIFLHVDLSIYPADFEANRQGELTVPLFADLKRHYMGEGLAESFGSALDGHFTTARLWGVADSAPYLHDGRALTIGDAIRLHGGEAETARNNYVALTDAEKFDLLSFLHTLRTPPVVGADMERDSTSGRPNSRGR